MRWVRTARVVLSVSWFFLTGGWVFLLKPRWNGGVRGVVLRASLMVVRYVLFWAVVAAVVWAVHPTLLVGTRAGLQTALQVVPAAVVALLVLALGSLFVIAQTATSIWGTRAPVVLTVDNEVAVMLGRPLVLAAVSILLAGQVPDNGSPAPWTTAAVAALVLATCRLFMTLVTLSAALLQRYTLPRGFPQYVVEDIGRELEAGDLGLVVYRGPMLGEMARLALRRGDSTAFAHTMEAASAFQADVVAAASRNPALRSFTTDDGAVRDLWLAEDLCAALGRVGEDALYSVAPSRDTNLVAETLGGMAAVFTRAGDQSSAERVAATLTELGTSSHQVSPGVTNYYGEPAFQLAYVESEAEAAGLPQLAAYALAGWSLCTAYPAYHLQQDFHPLAPLSIQTFGPSPPWQDARRLIRSDAWQQRWANKQYVGPDPVDATLEAAEQAHASRPSG